MLAIVNSQEQVHKCQNGHCNCIPAVDGAIGVDERGGFVPWGVPNGSLSLGGVVCHTKAKLTIISVQVQGKMSRGCSGNRKLPYWHKVIYLPIVSPSTDKDLLFSAN